MPSSDTQKLATIALDLQIRICTFLHPSDILSLRKTCKALQLATTRRIVWIDALHRICLDNTLFIPSFPIPNMSNVALERAALRPRRWIRLCSAFARQHTSRSGKVLFPATKRTIQVSRGPPPGFVPRLFLVPGGRYLVSSYNEGMDVWDLGYASNGDCKLLASVSPEDGPLSCEVSATSDGLGLIIVAPTPRDSTHRYYSAWSVYEIYPQSETPQLTKIAQVDCDPSKYPSHQLLPDRVVWKQLYDDRIVFRVWDYRLNHSKCFSADVDVKKTYYKVQVITTKTMLIVLSEEVLIWDISLLSPQPPDFFDHNPPHIPPLFRIPFPDDPALKDGFTDWQMISSWYSGSPKQFFFDVLCSPFKLHGFELVVKPDLSDVSLHVINTSRHPSYDFYGMVLGKYRVCEDTLVSCWDTDMSDTSQCTVSMSSRPPTNILPGGFIILQVSLPGIHYATYPSACPASGRFVYPDKNDFRTVYIVDFLSDT